MTKKSVTNRSSSAPVDGQPKDKERSGKSRKKRLLKPAIYIPLLLICVGLLVFTLGTCKRGEQPADSTSLSITENPTTTTRAPTTTPSPTPEPTPTPTSAAPSLQDINLLTGLNRTYTDRPQQRPIAVMINNTRKALPQIGISEADLIVEMLVEYGITRLLAVYAEPEAIPELGSIRSARHDFVEIATGMDALLAHFGGSYIAMDMIEENRLQTLNLMNHERSYWRDPDWRRDRGHAHSVKTTGERISALLEARTQIRRELSEPRLFFEFHHPDQFFPAAGEPALQVRVPFSRDTVAEFFYDEESRLYSKHQFRQPHLDLATGQPLRFSNLIILQTPVPEITSRRHVDADLSAGEGFYLAGGFMEPILWQKGELHDPLQFFRQDGSPLTINCGKTYIGVVPLENSIRITEP